MTDAEFAIELEARGARFLPSWAVITMLGANTRAFRRQAFEWASRNRRHVQSFTLDIGSEARP